MGDNKKCTRCEEIIKENFDLEDVRILNDNIPKIIEVFKKLKRHEINKDNQVDI